jgi:hypothetical protein
MKKPAATSAAGDADDGTVSTATPFPLPYRIATLKLVSFGSKAVEARVEIDGFGSIEVDVFRPEGRPAFAVPASVRDKFSGAWRRTFRLADDFAAELLRAIEAQLAGEQTGS